MTKLNSIKLTYINKRDLKIHPSAAQAFIASQKCRLQVALDKIPSCIKDLPTQLPLTQFSYGVYHVVANWQVLQESALDKEKIPVLIQPKRFSEEVTRQAWSYYFYIFALSIHKNRIIESASLFFNECPESIQNKIFGNNKYFSEKKAAELLGVSRASYRSASQRGK